VSKIDFHTNYKYIQAGIDGIFEYAAKIEDGSAQDIYLALRNMCNDILKRLPNEKTKKE